MRGPLLLTALLLVSCQTAEQKKPPEPTAPPQKTAAELADERQMAFEKGLPEDAVITLEKGPGGGCITKIDKDSIDLTGKKTVTWRVFNNCGDRERVAVGIVTPKHPTPAHGTPVPEYYLPFVCQYWPVDDGRNRAIWCAIDTSCYRDDFYKYKVCVNGRVALDPEIRIKGDNKPPAAPNKCPKVADQFTAEWRCGVDSTLNGF